MATTHNRNLFAFLSINNKRYPLFNGHNFVGRNKKADIILKDISTSQQHAVITILCNKIYISDLKSSNSTYIQSSALIPLHLYEITDQCELKFGTVKAILIINNRDYETDGSLIESQFDDAVFGLETQLQYEDASKSISITLLQPTIETFENRDECKDQTINRTVGSNSNKLPGLTQLFLKARKVFQSNNTQFPYSEAVISKSDSDTDDEIITIDPTQDLANNVNVLLKKNNNPRVNLIKANHIKSEMTNNGIQNNVQQSICNLDIKGNIGEIQEIPIKNECSSQSSQLLRVKRKSTIRVINSDSDTDLDDKIGSMQKENLYNVSVLSTENISSSQPIKVIRKSTKQMILSDSDTDLENGDELNHKIKSNHDAKDVLIVDKTDLGGTDVNSRKLLMNSENIDSNSKEDLGQKTIKSLGDDPSSQSIKVKYETDKQIELSDIDNVDSNPALESKKNTKYQSISRTSELIKPTKKIYIDNCKEENELRSKDTNNLENVGSKEATVESDYDTDLDDNTSSQITTAKRKVSMKAIESDSDTDLDDNSNHEKNSLKFGSGIKILDTNQFSVDSDSAESMEFDLNNTKFKEDSAKFQKCKPEETITNKSNIQDFSNDVIISSDENDPETEDNAILKLYKNNKIQHPLENKIDLHNNAEPIVNESMAMQDITQYICSTRNNQILNDTGGTNYDELSFIPATQDIGENVEISATETQNLQLLDKASQGSFHLGISEYMSHSESEDKLGNCKLTKVEKMPNRGDGPNKISPPSQTDSNLYNNKVESGKELFLVTTQQLNNESNVKLNAVVLNVAIEAIDDAIFLVPTQQINSDNNYDSIDQDDENSIFGRPTQKLPRDGADQSDNEIEKDNVLLIREMNSSHENNDGFDENSLFVEATQKLRKNESIKVDNSLFSEPSQELQIDEQTNENREDNSVPSTSEQVLSQRSCTEDNGKYSLKSDQIPQENIIDLAIIDKPTKDKSNVADDIFDVPTQIVIHRLDINKRIHSNNIENTNLFDLPTQVVSHKTNTTQKSDPKNIFDVPTQIIIQRLDINKKIDSNDIENTNLCDLPTQVVSHKTNTTQKSDPKNIFDVPKQIIIQRLDINKKIDSNDIENTNLCDLPTQVVSHKTNTTQKSDPKNIFDVPTQIIIQRLDINKKIDSNDIENTNLCDLPTQVVSHKTNTTQKNYPKITKKDLFDIPTQIISNIASKFPSPTHEGQNQEKSVQATKIKETNANTDLFDLPTQILVHPQECKKNENSDNNHIASISIQREIKILDEKVGAKSIKNNVANSIEINKVNIITENKNEAQKVKELTTQKSRLRLYKSIELKLEINMAKKINDANIFEESVQKDIMSTPRITRQKSKKTANQKDKKKFQKDYRKVETKIAKGLNKFVENKDTEDNINEIKRTIANMKDNPNDQVEITHNSDADKPMYCTQEVLQVLSSDSPIKNVQSENSTMSTMQTISAKMAQSSKKVGKDKFQNLKGNVYKSMYSTQDVIDVLSSDSPAKYKEDENAPIFIKPNDMKAIDKKTFKRKSAKERNGNLMQKELRKLKRNVNENDSREKDKLQTKIPMFSTQDVLDVLTSDDVAKDDQLDKVGTEENLMHPNETNDSLSESIFIMGTKKLHINLQSTMISVKDYDTVNNNDDIPSDDDFEDIKTKSEVPPCTTINIKNNLNDQNTSAALMVKPKSKKRVVIKDSDLDVIHEIPIQVTNSCIMQNRMPTKHKFSPFVQDDENDVEAQKDLEMPTQKTSKIDEPESQSKNRSGKEKIITGILKKTTKLTRSTKTTKTSKGITILDNTTSVSADNKACMDENTLTDTVVSNCIRRGRSRKASNNNNTNTDDISESTKPTKRGRPKKSSAGKTSDSGGAIQVPTLKRVALKRSISNVESEVNERAAVPGTSKQSFEDEVDSKDKKRKSNDLPHPLINGCYTHSVGAKGFRTDSTISDSQTSLSQRSKRQLKPKVVFTMLNSPELESIIRCLGGTVVDSVEVSSVLVTTSVKRTEKLLTAIGQGKPICSEKWLKECKVQNKFLDPWCHICRDMEAETKWDFSLEDSLERSRNKKLFENYTMMLIVNSAQDILKKAIESTGGKCVTSVRKRPQNFVIVSVAENQKKFQKYIKDESDLMIVEPEAIFDAVLRQEIRFNMFKLV